MPISISSHFPPSPDKKSAISRSPIDGIKSSDALTGERFAAFAMSALISIAAIPESP